MRLVINCNAAGDVRVRVLRDKPEARPAPLMSDALLVCSNSLQEMTTPLDTGPRAGFGKLPSTGALTRYARTFLRELGSLMDEGPLTNCVFLTGTLPGGTHAALTALSVYSGWVVQTVTQWVRDFAPGALYFGVWEYQKRGALHLHLCVRTPSQREARELKTRWKARWTRILDSVARRSGVDVYQRKDGGSWVSQKWVVRTDAQTVEKSVGNYLAKYLGKGSAKNRASCDAPPSAWYFAQKTLRKETRERRRELQVTNLAPTDSANLYQRGTALVAERALQAYTYTGKFDAMVKGLVGLLRPIPASLLYDELTTVLKVLMGSARESAPLLLPTVDHARLLFCGKKIPAIGFT